VNRNYLLNISSLIRYNKLKRGVIGSRKMERIEIEDEQRI
jgi:hypothetical protein